MADPDDKAAFLLELFPEESLESIYNTLLNNNCDLDESIKTILGNHYQLDQDLKDESVFDLLVNTFPDVEIEAIEAFLLTQDESADFEILLKEFVKQSSCPASPGRDRNLKMKLADFNAILKTSNEEILDKGWKINKTSEVFSFSFLEDDDMKEYEELSNASGLEVRQMAVELQSERMERLKRAATCFKSGNLTGRSSASYYSDEGQSLAPKIAKLHRIAAEKIFIEKNENLKYSKSIDLHYLTVAEAQSVISAFLNHHEMLKTLSVKVITGRGNHSTGGICKLSSATLNLLRNQGRKYSFDGIATFTINFY